MNITENDFKKIKSLDWSVCRKMLMVWPSKRKHITKYRLFLETVESVLLYGLGHLVETRWRMKNF